MEVFAQNGHLAFAGVACGGQFKGEVDALGDGGTASSSMRWPKARAASTNWGSFMSVKACKGVLERLRLTLQVSRLGASNIIMLGGGLVRFQKVYMLRR